MIAMVLMIMKPVQNSNVDESNVIHMGSPVHSVTILGAAVGKDQNGHPMVYTVSSNGNPAVLSVLDGRTGELVNSFKLEGAAGAWGATAVPGGDVYLSSYNNAYLFRYTPGADHVVRLKIPRASKEKVLYSTTYDDQGNVYFGSYPNAKVIMYNPTTNKFKDYGTIMKGREYVRSVAYGHGKIYAGIGVPAHLIEIDAKTGAKKEIALPEKFKEVAEVYNLNVEGNKLFVRLMDVYTTLVYDLDTREWAMEIPNSAGLSISPADSNGKVYFRTSTKSNSLSADQNLHAYDLNTNQLIDTGFRMSSAPRRIGWIDLEEPDFPGMTIIAVDTRGTLSYYNPQNRNTKQISTEPVGVPNRLNALAKGPDGNIYIGGYLSPQEGAVYNPHTNQITKLPGLTQVEGMGAHDGKMYFGTYPGARLWQFDPTSPWEIRTNPSELFSLQLSKQDRPYAVISAGDRVAIGTFPENGFLGGVLALYDPQTKKYETMRSIVEDQAIISLAYRDGYIYGGTDIRGGSGTSPTTKEAKLFIYDLQRKEKVWEGVPVKGKQVISALTFDEEGNLWGLASSTMFKFDLVSRTVVSKKTLFRNRANHKGWMEFYKDGKIYGTILNRVFQFDPLTEKVTVLANDATYFAQDDYGDIYFVRDLTDLYKLERQVE